MGKKAKPIEPSIPGITFSPGTTVVFEFEKTRDLIKRMADYIRLVRVGDDAADLLAEADSVIGVNADDSGKQATLPLEDPDAL